MEICLVFIIRNNIPFNDLTLIQDCIKKIKEKEPEVLAVDHFILHELYDLEES